MKHLLVDLFCGRGGWSRCAMRLGWDCIGYDITDLGYPGRLITRKLPLALAEIMAHRPQAITASPPCEEYARHHLPWLRGPKPDTMLLWWAVTLTACVDVPMIVECSRFAALHVPGSSRCGSYRLWGSVPTLLPTPRPQKTCKSGTDPAARAMIPEELAEAFFYSLKENP